MSKMMSPTTGMMMMVTTKFFETKRSPSATLGGEDSFVDVIIKQKLNINGFQKCLTTNQSSNGCAIRMCQR